MLFELKTFVTEKYCRSLLVNRDPDPDSHDNFDNNPDPKMERIQIVKKTQKACKAINIKHYKIAIYRRSGDQETVLIGIWIQKYFLYRDPDGSTYLKPDFASVQFFGLVHDNLISKKRI